MRPRVIPAEYDGPPADPKPTRPRFNEAAGYPRGIPGRAVGIVGGAG